MRAAEPDHQGRLIKTFLPKKLAAVAAESELFKVSQRKFVPFDFNDLLLADGVPPTRTMLLLHSNDPL